MMLCCDVIMDVTESNASALLQFVDDQYVRTGRPYKYKLSIHAARESRHQYVCTHERIATLLRTCLFVSQD